MSDDMRPLDPDIERRRLTFEKILVSINAGPDQGWLMVSGSLTEDGVECHIYCAVISQEMKDDVMKDTDWELSPNAGMPYYETFNNTGYLRYGRSDDIQPLVFFRYFGGMREECVEICEEFRHYHDLYFDQRDSKFVKIDENGNEHDVVRIEDKSVYIRMNYLREYLGAKSASLAIYFDSNYRSPLSLNEVGLNDAGNIIEERNMIFSHAIRNDALPPAKSLSRLLGKKLYPGPSIEEFLSQSESADQRQYLEFIIDVDSNGNPISHTCDPDQLVDCYGKNPYAPNFLTPVFFKREVLTKYYQSPDRFTVHDAQVKCGGLWMLKIDNNREDCVIAYLGDLGETLSYDEQKYWSSYNILPQGGLSSVQVKRDFLAEATEPTQSDLKFKERLREFRRRWRLIYNWDLFMPLSESDQHFEKTLRVPLSESQSEFDSQVLALSKVLIDSLNEKELVKGLESVGKEIKSIKKLEAFLQARSLNGVDPHLKFLRNLQSLRSTGSAHRKGSQFETLRKDLGLDDKGLVNSFSNILDLAVELLSWLEAELIENRSNLPA